MASSNNENIEKFDFKKYNAEYYEKIKAVKKAVDSWNPYSLLPDAPDDEFDSESYDVAKRITFSSSEKEIALVISDVFSKAFVPQDFPVESCMEIAKNIKKNLSKKYE